jgi:hypothetical protein
MGGLEISSLWGLKSERARKKIILHGPDQPLEKIAIFLNVLIGKEEACVQEFG